MVDTHDDRHVRLLGRRRDDDAPCAARDVLRRVVTFRESAGPLEHYVHPEALPRQLRGVFHRQYLEFVVVDGDLIAGRTDLRLQVSNLSSATKTIPGLEHGTYIGSSLNAVGADDAFASALSPFLGAIGSVLGVSTSWLLSQAGASNNPPAAGDYYKAQKQLTPGILQPYLDRHLYMKEGTQVAPQSSSLQGE